MKTVILAGGFGTRLAEKTDAIPKPMVEIGQRPLLWHIMKHYAHFGHEEFLIALGYRGEVIKRYFRDHAVLNSDLTIKTGSGEIVRHGARLENWTVHLIDTGIETVTGGRIKRLATHLGAETFLMTYGDGVSNVDLNELVAFHKRHGKLATVTAVRPPARFGGLVFAGDQVTEFTEKPMVGEGWINGGFFVFEPKVLDYIAGDATHLEIEPLERLATDGQLMAYKHEGFWGAMDTMRDRLYLEQLWEEGKAPWKSW